jgi:hypothetical protein
LFEWAGPWTVIETFRFPISDLSELDVIELEDSSSVLFVPTFAVCPQGIQNTAQLINQNKNVRSRFPLYYLDLFSLSLSTFVIITHS